MKEIKKNINIDYIQLVLFFIYMIILYIYGSSSDTVVYSEIILLIFLGIEFLKIIKNRKMKFCVPIILMFFFALFCLLSSFWSIDPNITLIDARTQIILVIFVLISYNFFINIDNGAKKLLKIIMYAGLIFSFYIIIYYGVKNYIDMLIKGIRVGTELNNVNTIGLQTSISVIIAIFFALYENNKKYFLVTILPLIVSLGTGSRKVLITLVLGTVLLFLLNRNKKFNIKNATKKIIYFVILVGIFFAISQTQIFSTIFSRFQSAINMFTENGVVDGSARTRKLLIDLGIEQFKKTPFFGIGMGNAKYLSLYVIGEKMYLHNNYVELLSSVGIFGFLIYYSTYVYIIIYCLKFLKQKNPYINIVLVIFLVNLVLEFAMVSYYSKNTRIYILLAIVTLHNARKEQLNEKKKLS